MSNFLQEFSEYDSSLEKQSPTYSGLLGLGIGGSNQVNVLTRPGFVYVRLRDNLSEVIQVYNDKVSPIYDFPVLIQRSGNRWVVLGKDTNRYETWATPAPFLPAHAGQHSFNRDANLGGDTVFVYPDQFMPLLVYPSGTFGAGMLMIAPYVLQRTSDFICVGNTGTQNLLVYKPTNNQAIMGLVVLNTDTGNPQVLIASGTPLSASITGTASVLPYVPQPASNQEALYAFRLVSGTNAIGWGNLYNARQFVGGQGGSSSSGINVWDEGVPDGSGITTLDFIGSNVDVTVSGTVARVFVTGSSGGSLPSFITGSIPYAGANGQLTENNPLLRWDETYRGLRLGRTSNFPILNFADVIPLGMVANNPNETVAISGLVYGTGTSGSPSLTLNGYRARGTGSTVIAPVQSGDALLTLIGAGYDGANFINGSRIRFYADTDWVTGAYTPTRMDFEVTPSGSTARRTQFQVYGESVNIPTGSTYNVGGTPHTHQVDDQFITNANDIFALSLVGASGWTGTINGAPSGAVVTYTNVSGNRNTLVPSSTSQLGKQRLYNTTRGNYALISTSNGTNNITLTANAPGNWANGDTITTISPTVASGQNHVDIEVSSGELVGKSNVWLWGVIIDTGASVLMRFHPFETFAAAKQFNVFSPAAAVAFGGLQAYKLVSNIITIAWTSSGASTASPTIRQIGYIK